MADLVFLLSDSRSGSTWFSKALHNACQDLVVTPEISLLYALRALKVGERNPEKIKEALIKGRFFQSLGIPESTFPTQGAITDAVFTQFIRNALAKFARTGWPDRTVRKVVIKKGHHAFEAAYIARLFPEAQFLCLYRDPRAVYESKKRTVRPYRPHETMGWAGIALTGYRWRQYTQLMLDIETRFDACRVKFEALAQDKETMLRTVIQFLGLDKAAQEADDYKINPTEQTIHTRSVRAMTQDSSTWQDRLKMSDVEVIEAVTRAEMAALGYPRMTSSTPLIWLRVVLSVLGGGVEICKRAIRARFARMAVSKDADAP